MTDPSIGISHIVEDSSEDFWANYDKEEWVAMPIPLRKAEVIMDPLEIRLTYKEIKDLYSLADWDDFLGHEDLATQIISNIISEREEPSAKVNGLTYDEILYLSADDEALRKFMNDAVYADEFIRNVMGTEYTVSPTSPTPVTSANTTVTSSGWLIAITAVVSIISGFGIMRNISTRRSYF